MLRQRIAPIGMKPFCGTGDAIKKGVVSAQDALSYAMSLPVATTISGIDSMTVFKQNVEIEAGSRKLEAGSRTPDAACLGPRVAEVSTEVLCQVCVDGGRDGCRQRNGSR